MSLNTAYTGMSTNQLHQSSGLSWFCSEQMAEGDIPVSITNHLKNLMEKHLKLWCHLHTKMNHHTCFSVQDFKKCPALSSSADTREEASGEGPLQLHAQKPPLQQDLAGQQVNSPGVLSVLKTKDLSGALAALPFPSHVLLAQKLPHAAVQTLGPALEHQPMPCSQISLLHSSSRAANVFLRKKKYLQSCVLLIFRVQSDQQLYQSNTLS